jgi:hypothetical protein
VALAEVEVDLPHEIRRRDHQGADGLQLGLGVGPLPLGHAEPAFEQPHGGAPRAVELLDPADGLLDLLELVLLEERVGEHQQQRRFAGQLLHAVEQHLLRLGKGSLLHRDRGQAAIDPLVLGGDFPAPLGVFAGGGQILAGQGEFEGREDAVDVVGVELHGGGDVGLGVGELATLPLPAAAGQPGLHVLGLLGDELLEHGGGGGIVVEFVFEDGREDHVGLRGRGGRADVVERPSFHVEADHGRHDPGGLGEVARPEIGPRHQQFDADDVEGFLVIVGRRRGLGQPLLDPLLEDVEMLAGVARAADPELELGQLAPQVVIFGVAAHRRLERVVGAAEIIAGGVGGLGPGEHELRVLGIGLVVLRPEPDVPGVDLGRFRRLALVEPLFRQLGQVAGVAQHLESTEQHHPDEQAHHGHDEDDQKLEVDPFHVGGNSGLLVAGRRSGKAPILPAAKGPMPRPEGHAPGVNFGARSPKPITPKFRVPRADSNDGGDFAAWADPEASGRPDAREAPSPEDRCDEPLHRPSPPPLDAHRRARGRGHGPRPARRGRRIRQGRRSHRRRTRGGDENRG